MSYSGYPDHLLIPRIKASLSASNKTVYLISGSNRGIGYGLATLIAAHLDTIVFAGARDPAAQSLKDLAAKHPNVHPVKLTSGDQADNEAAIIEIQKTAGRLDVIIANAGIANTMGSVASTPPSAFREHWEVNTLGRAPVFRRGVAWRGVPQWQCWRVPTWHDEAFGWPPIL
ncbi:hypothetical protein B0H16DRAFT_1730272 [Mycena metata]|uniref:NAD(P)-binding protein n=1 Tax=Mycena metata TaxID=1033252 RepID=A0AAD7IA22_9AGAR|nr:hypothetical protein B0H16DRAFT_1730272 [Mycena metata]